MDKNLNELLKWSIEAQTAGSNSQNNTSTSATTTAAAANGNGDAPPATEPRALNPEILSALLGGPSDAQLMTEAMAVITSADADITLDDRLTAFDNFEQLIESLDNANNMPQLGLWAPLLSMLDSAAADLRRYAAWCVGTAVQNNEKSQERLLAMGGLPRLVGLATDAAEKEDVRRKAVYALSSACRNYQPAMDVVAKELEKGGQRKEGQGKVDAANMDAVDEVMNALKDSARSDAQTSAA